MMGSAFRLVQTGAVSQPSISQSLMVHTGPGPQGVSGGQPSPRLVGEARTPAVCSSAYPKETAVL